MDRSQVWYASFGSNLWPARFRVYLEGGVPPGSTGSSPGARDATPPSGSATRFCTNQLMFGGAAAQWGGGGVAFLSSEPGEHSTALRMYRITGEQFEDVFFQENGMDAAVPVDFTAAVEHGHLDAVDRRYGRVLHLGQHDDGLHIFTITTHSPPEVRAPHPSYIRTLTNGLLMTVDGHHFGLDSMDAVRDQLSPAEGMADFSTRDWTAVNDLGPA